LSDSIENSSSVAEQQQGNQNISELIFRVLPYWYIFLIVFALGIAGAYLYLKRATPFYEIKAQIVVNDESKEKNNEFTKNNAPVAQEDKISLVEKQLEIIQSKALLENVVKKINLNIQWAADKEFKYKQILTNPPVTVEFSTPELIKEEMIRPVKILSDQNQVQFNGAVYTADTLVSSPFGMCRWHINKEIKYPDSAGLYVRIGPVGDFAALIKDRLEVLPLSKESKILNLSLTDEFPERGELIMATIIDYYGESSLKNEKKLLQNSLSFIEERLNLVSSSLKGVESSLQSYKAQQGITDLTTEGQLYLGQVKDNDQQIGEIDVQINVLNQIEEYLSNRNQSGSTIPATLGLSDQVLVSLLTDLFKDENEKEKLLKLSGVKNPQVKLMEDRITQRKSSIMESVRNLKNSLQTSKSTLVGNNNRFNSSLRNIPQKEKMLIEITRDHNIKNELYTYLLQKREEMAIELAGISSNYTIIEKPENTGMVKPKPLLIYSYGVLLAGLLAGTWVYKKEFASSTILYRSEIEKSTKIPIVGEFIYGDEVVKDAVVIKPESRTLLAEQFRELRANINYLLSKKKTGKVILVTSSVPNEGKSFISVNLAMSFALSGKKTALVEFDLYKPRISSRLGIENTNGINDYLTDKIGLNELCRVYDSVNNLWIVPSGTELVNPAELLLQDKLEVLMDYLGNEFENIIVDTPCIGLVSDTKILAKYADISLFVIRQNYTHHGFFKYINDLKKMGHLPNLHLVFNGIKIKKFPGVDYWGSYGVNGYRYGNKNTYAYTSNPKKK
jgi:tyrosine-protein kinase Etk/Wzc